MRFYDVTFFCDKGNPPLVSLNSDNEDFDWPVTVRINQTGEFFKKPSITFYVHSEVDLIKFKNSVISAFQDYERRIKNAP